MPTIIDQFLVTFGIKADDFDAGKKKVDAGIKDTGDQADKTGEKLRNTGKDAATGIGKFLAIIGSIPAKLKDFAAGLKSVGEESDKTDDKVKKTSKTTVSGVESAAKGFAKFLAVLGGTMAIKRFVTDTVESSAALERFSKNAGTAADTVSAWANAAEIAGGSASGMQATIDMLSRSQTELQLTGQSGLIPYFSALGVAIADTQGKARPFDAILLDLADRFAKLDRPTAFNMGRMMGIDGDTMNLLLKGRVAVESAIARQKEFGAVSKEQAAQAESLREETAALKNGFMAFARELLGDAMPALAGITGALGRGLAWMRQHREFVKIFFGTLTAGLAGATAAATAFAIATSPITLAVLALVALSAAIAGLWDDYQTWKNGGDSLIDWAKWEPGINAALNGAKSLASGFVTAFQTMRQWSHDAADAIGNRWTQLRDTVTGIADWIASKYAAAKRFVGLGDDPAPPSPAPAPKRASVADTPRAATPAPMVPTVRPESAPATPTPPLRPESPQVRPESAPAPAALPEPSRAVLNAPTAPRAAPAPAQAAASPRPGAAPSLPRGIRNNNPGNLNFANQTGASKESGPGGRFAVFNSMQEGVAALVKQIGLYVDRGRNTIRKIIEIYAPPSENNTNAYVSAVSKSLGVGPDEPIDKENAGIVKGLIRAIADHENGSKPAREHVTSDHIESGYDLAKRSGKPRPVAASEPAKPAAVPPRPVAAGIPQAAANVPRVAPGQGASVAAVAAAGPKQQAAPISSTVETKIDKIEIHTQAKDAAGIAREIAPRLDFAFANQANTGIF